MGGSSSQDANSLVRGDNGQRVFEKTHTDIDESTLDISCNSGSCRVSVEEAIWYSWETKLDQQLSQGGRINQQIEIDSDIYDADHRLVVIAQSDGTEVSIVFRSIDR